MQHAYRKATIQCAHNVYLCSCVYDARLSCARSIRLARRLCTYCYNMAVRRILETPSLLAIRQINSSGRLASGSSNDYSRQCLSASSVHGTITVCNLS